MPWCPKCKCEYEKDVSVCSDCECELVDELKEDNEEKQYDEEVLLISVRGDMEANIIESKLHAFGIPTLKRYNGSGQYLSISMGTTFYGIGIYVPSKALEAAKEIIKED